MSRRGSTEYAPVGPGQSFQDAFLIFSNEVSSAFPTKPLFFQLAEAVQHPPLDTDPQFEAKAIFEKQLSDLLLDLGFAYAESKGSALSVLRKHAQNPEADAVFAELVARLFKHYHNPIARELYEFLASDALDDIMVGIMMRAGKRNDGFPVIRKQLYLSGDQTNFYIKLRLFDQWRLVCHVMQHAALLPIQTNPAYALVCHAVAFSGLLPSDQEKYKNLFFASMPTPAFFRIFKMLEDNAFLRTRLSDMERWGLLGFVVEHISNISELVENFELACQLVAFSSLSSEQRQRYGKAFFSELAGAGHTEQLLEWYQEKRFAFVDTDVLGDFRDALFSGELKGEAGNTFYPPEVTEEAIDHMRDKMDGNLPLSELVSMVLREKGIAKLDAAIEKEVGLFYPEYLHELATEMLQQLVVRGASPEEMNDYFSRVMNAGHFTRLADLVYFCDRHTDVNTSCQTVSRLVRTESLREYWKDVAQSTEAGWLRNPANMIAKGDLDRDGARHPFDIIAGRYYVVQASYSWRSGRAEDFNKACVLPVARFLEKAEFTSSASCDEYNRLMRQFHEALDPDTECPWLLKSSSVNTKDIERLLLVLNQFFEKCFGDRSLLDKSVHFQDMDAVQVMVYAHKYLYDGLFDQQIKYLSVEALSAHYPTSLDTISSLRELMISQASRFPFGSAKVMLYFELMLVKDIMQAVLSKLFSTAGGITFGSSTARLFSDCLEILRLTVVNSEGLLERLNDMEPGVANGTWREALRLGEIKLNGKSMFGARAGDPVSSELAKKIVRIREVVSVYDSLISGVGTLGCSGSARQSLSHSGRRGGPGSAP